MKKRILVVDDEVQMQNFILMVLRSSSQDILSHAASGGSEALELLHSHEFDLVIADVFMPEMNGSELQVAAKEKGFNIPFLFMSGYGWKKVFDIIGGDESDFIQKPFDVKTLQHVVLEKTGLKQCLPSLSQ